MLDVADPYAAYCLDTAVGSFGRAVEHALAGVKGKGANLAGARENMLRQWLGMEKRYRSPVATKM